VSTRACTGGGCAAHEPPITQQRAGHADFDLESFRQTLDKEGLKVAENQEASVKSRRGLADTTRSAPAQLCLSLLTRLVARWLRGSRAS